MMAKSGLAKWVAKQSEAYQVRIFAFGIFLETLIAIFWVFCFIAPLTEIGQLLAQVIAVQLVPAFMAVPIFFFRKAKKEPSNGESK